MPYPQEFFPKTPKFGGSGVEAGHAKWLIKVKLFETKSTIFDL
jgi:hypothetical protein